MQWLDTLQALTSPSGVSGHESPVAQVAYSILCKYCEDVHIQGGNVCGRIGVYSPNKPHVLLDAHMDQVGFLVTAITEDGFIRVGNAGGMDFRLMPAQRVIVHGKQDIPGVICCMPPHLQNGQEKVSTVEELAIDTGYTKENLEEIVQPGDSVSYDMPVRVLLNDRVTGASLDDRCGMASILYALELLQGKTLPCTLSVLFSTQEEVGERGAIIGAYTLEPDIAIAVDVTFAKGHGDDPTKCGKLGGGPMIGLSPSLSPTVSQDLMRVAQDKQIPWQREVMSGLTGTNADRFSVSRGGICAGTVSIPLLYMHTPSEVIQLSDLEATGQLLASYILQLGEV